MRYLSMKEPDRESQNSAAWLNIARRVSGQFTKFSADGFGNAGLGAQLAIRVQPRIGQRCLVVSQPSPSLCQPFYESVPQQWALSSPFGNSGRASTAATPCITDGDSTLALPDPLFPTNR